MVMKLIPTSLLLLLVVLFSCKKPTETDEPGNGNTVISATETHIRHNWTFVRSILNDYGANPGADTIHGQVGDYYIFHTNNKAYSFWDNVYDTISYQVLDGTSLLYGGDTMQINELSGKSFIFTKTVQSGLNDYENVIQLSK